MSQKDNNKYKHSMFRKGFINREDILDKINDAISDYNAGMLEKKVFIVIGMSGIGKTKLINKISTIYNEVFNKEQVIQITMHMEILGEETATTILQKIRENIVRAPLFDYAFLRYWELSKTAQLDRKYLRHLADSLPAEITTNLLAFIDASVPFLGTALSIGTSAISKIIKKGSNYYSKAYKDNGLSSVKSHIDSYFREDPVKILTYLPQLLAIDMGNYAGNKKQIYIFDAYDKTAKHMQNGVEWLKSLVDSLQSGIIIITCREEPGWSNDDFNYMFETLIVSEIPEQYVSEELHGYGLSEDIACKIISLTQCIPIYLDLVLSIYEKDGEKGLNELDRHKKEEFAMRLIDHLSEDEQWIAKILSVTQFVNNSIYDDMLAQNQLSSLKNSFKDFMSSTMVSYIEEYDGFYKVHDVFATDICSMLTLERKKKVASQFVEAIMKNIYRHTANENYLLICKCLQLGNSLFEISIDRCKYVKLGDSLVQLSLYLIENGLCNDLHTYFESMKVPTSSPVRTALDFTSAMYHRQNSISEGIAILQNIDPQSAWIDEQRKLIICETNYLEAILGNYIDAENKFKMFYESLKDNERNAIYYTKGSLYHADMLMMRGQFIDAIDIMQDVYGIQTEQTSFICFEIQKAVGHCHRFNWMFEKALEHYRRFEGHYAESIRMEAYRLTTECETYCFSEYKKAIVISEDAIEMNEALHNYNNLGKIYCSLCISHAQGKNYEYAQIALKQAYKMFSNTQYKSGIFFANISEVFLDYSKNNTVNARLLRKIDEQLGAIGHVYSFLLLPVYLLTNNSDKIRQLKRNNQWINYKETVKAITAFISRL